MILGSMSRGWQPYYLNFMFRHICGKPGRKKQAMVDEVIRFYSALVPYVVRKPRSPSWVGFLPQFVGCPDLPVAKSDARRLSSETNVNDGWHFNGVLLLPPSDKCRLKRPLLEHIDEHAEAYIRPDCPLSRIHITTITRGYLADYVFKHFLRGSFGCDDILILPRATSEMPLSHR